MRKHEDSFEVDQYEKLSSGVPVSANVGLHVLPALFVGVIAYYIYEKQVSVSGRVQSLNLRQY